eukprot:3496866-Amphidinium_carterae.1
MFLKKSSSNGRSSIDTSASQRHSYQHRRLFMTSARTSSLSDSRPKSLPGSIPPPCIKDNNR